MADDHIALFSAKITDALERECPNEETLRDTLKTMVDNLAELSILNETIYSNVETTTKDFDAKIDERIRHIEANLKKVEVLEAYVEQVEAAVAAAQKALAAEEDHFNALYPTSIRKVFGMFSLKSKAKLADQTREIPNLEIPTAAQLTASLDEV